MSKSRKSRRLRNAEAKMDVVLAGLEPGLDVSAFCRNEGLSHAQYDQWRSQLISSADAMLGCKGQKTDVGFLASGSTAEGKP